MGKKSTAAVTAHTNDYYTFEQWYSDITKSHTWPDAQIAKADIGLPSTGIATINISAMGLGARTKGGAQVLTSPTAESSSEVLTSINGVILIGGTKYITVTSASLSIDSGMSAGEAVIGSNVVTDNQRATVKVSGTLTVLYENDVVSDFLDNETATSLVLLATDNSDADADFVSFSLPRVKIFGDDADDGKKQIVRTYPWTAEYNGTGGAALANDLATISIQDSLAA
jgi:Phage tail tube protein